ncbi:helix-turn-helix domain-containing protein [Bradyrhizobium symbiodeficiens]|uniref:helix-turn-helix domain-containing protein n=1 Tax=Bradyrhizobium symbiodeficiens TaxID=1404367 RepID=UPI000BA1AD9D|nr:helix-turn-helix domain-containing protein [Bradyrhizobium symbiodeficiens]AWM07637.1 helix-turn-helix domain-containing protein [Bradyrhizobium symbiodeficiens]
MSARPIVVMGATGQRQWVETFAKAALSEKYPARAIALAMVLIELHFNRKTGQCNPGYPLLAAELGCSERTVMRAGNDLEAKGWIKRRAPGQHVHVEFTFTIPSQSGVTTAVTSERAPEVTGSSTRGDNCCPPFNEEHLNTRNRRSQFRSSPGVHEFAKIEAESRAANERVRKWKGSPVGLTTASS